MLKLRVQTLRGGISHCNKYFLYKKLRSQYIYSVKNTMRLTSIRTQNFVHNFNNKEGISQNLQQAHLLFVWNVVILRKVLKEYSTLLSENYILKWYKNCILKHRAPGLALVLRGWWSLISLLLIISFPFTQRKVCLLQLSLKCLHYTFKIRNKNKSEQKVSALSETSCISDWINESLL